MNNDHIEDVRAADMDSARKEDIKTKVIFADALMTLLRTNTLDKITVAEIADKSGHSRTTFYRHFVDKQELMTWVYTHQADMRIKSYYDIDLWYDQTVAFLRAFQDNSFFFKKVISYDGQNSLRDAIRERGTDYFERHMKAALNVDVLPENLSFAARYHAYANTQAIVEWIEVGMPGTAEHMASLIVDGLPSIMKPFFSRDGKN